MASAASSGHCFVAHAIFDTPIPDPKLSADLAALAPRMKGIEAVQVAQSADIAALRARSEAAVRGWYEQGIVGNSEFVSRWRGRLLRWSRGPQEGAGGRGR